MKQRTRSLLNVTGALGGLIFLLLAFFSLGWVKLVLFVLFLILALQDALSARVHVATFLPAGILLGLYYLEFTIAIFVPVFGILLFIWAVVGLLQKSLSSMDPEKCYFGFGDVLGLPLAVTISQVFAPFVGLIAFTIGIAAVMPWFIRRKQLRFLPWLVPGVLLAFVVAIIF